MTQPKAIRVIPGALLPEDVTKYFLLPKKYCKGCGAELDFWCIAARPFHSLHCKYGIGFNPYHLRMRIQRDRELKL